MPGYVSLVHDRTGKCRLVQVGRGYVRLCHVRSG